MAWVNFAPNVFSVVLTKFFLIWNSGLNQNFLFILSVFNRNCKLSNSNFSMASVDILYIDITRRWNSMGIDHKESGNAILYLKTKLQSSGRFDTTVPCGHQGGLSRFHSNQKSMSMLLV